MSAFFYNDLIALKKAGFIAYNLFKISFNLSATLLLNLRKKYMLIHVMYKNYFFVLEKYISYLFTQNTSFSSVEAGIWLSAIQQIREFT